MAEQRMKEVKEDSSALKHFFGKELLNRMGKALAVAYPAFDTKAFRKLEAQLDELEMKPRVQLIREELKRQLPADYKKAVAVLVASLKSGSITGFDLWPYTDFVQTYGLENRPLSLDTLKKLTTLFTAEFAVRPFLRLHTDETLRYLERCALDPDVHLRRWASEGSRPRLPWGERLQDFVKDPKPTPTILEALKFDEELYVRKSVANHLNDIAKDHPDYVIKLLSRWQKAAGKEHEAKITWIIHRALRTLIKAGHPAALKLIGVTHDAPIKLSGLKINQKTYKLGERMDFAFKIESLADKPQKLVVDYIVHYAKANAKTAPKVFKLKTVLLPADSHMTISKSHHLKHVTTRVHYAGTHALEIQVNGVILKRINWVLEL